MKGEVLGAWIGIGPREFEELARKPLGALDFALGDEHLAHTGQGARLSSAIA